MTGAIWKAQRAADKGELADFQAAVDAARVEYKAAWSAYERHRRSHPHWVQVQPVRQSDGR
ncbi:MAG TPA: hypothetical protein VK789_33550 [Bryobacteraceae bacterium]|nr:hypothetical protein [Bryobacteraceae bacterium]